jgi:hypothetical protein
MVQTKIPTHKDTADLSLRCSKGVVGSILRPDDNGHFEKLSEDASGPMMAMSSIGRLGDLRINS